MGLLEELRVEPGSKAVLRDTEAGKTPGVDGRTRAETDLAENRKTLEALQYHLWAENKQALLIVLQGMDTAGKDGVIRKVLTGMNPQGCRVTSFKKPSEEDSDHDFLWRIHKAVPGKGEVGVFNRSHYEDVLVVRVHKLVPKSVWESRYEMINRFERLLIGDHTTIVKICLHISKAEQKKRLLARLADNEKSWKFTAQDIEERNCWDEYVEAYQDMLSRCSTREAPWYVVPADNKWYRNWAVSELLVKTLEEMDPKIPESSFKPGEFVIAD